MSSELIESAIAVIEITTTVIEVSKPIIKTLTGSDDKDKVGEFFVRDKNFRQWEVKVRETGKRGRYLKIKSTVSGKKVRASADGYKPEKYRCITPEEWIVCARYAQGEENKSSQVASVLNRLIK